MNEKKTVGQMYVEAQKTEDAPMSLRELTDAMHQEYEAKLIETIENGKKQYPDEKYFFIEDITKQERLMMKVLRHIILPRMTCPTPNYDQTVYRYHVADDALEYIWTIPSPASCQMYRANALMVAPEERELLQFVLDFDDGTLEK